MTTDATNPTTAVYSASEGENDDEVFSSDEDASAVPTGDVGMIAADNLPLGLASGPAGSSVSANAAPKTKSHKPVAGVKKSIYSKQEQVLKYNASKDAMLKKRGVALSYIVKLEGKLVKLRA